MRLFHFQFLILIYCKLGKDMLMVLDQIVAGVGNLLRFAKHCNTCFSQHLTFSLYRFNANINETKPNIFTIMKL